jgi:hypothetical protein
MNLPKHYWKLALKVVRIYEAAQTNKHLRYVIS